MARGNGLKPPVPLLRRDVCRWLLATGTIVALWPADARGQGATDPAHRVQIDVPILADDPSAVPLTLSVEHPMEPDHYLRSLEVTLDTDPVPRKGTFRFTPLAGRASIAYQMRSGQGGELRVVAECSRHGRFESRQTARVAAGGCAVPAGTGVREAGDSPTLKASARVRPGEVLPVWASLKHSSHTGLVESKGKFLRERDPFFVERVTAWLASERVAEFQLTAAVSPDPRLRFFVRAAPGQTLRVVFANNKGQRWEASHLFG